MSDPTLLELAIPGFAGAAGGLISGIVVGCMTLGGVWLQHRAQLKRDDAQREHETRQRRAADTRNAVADVVTHLLPWQSYVVNEITRIRIARNNGGNTAHPDHIENIKPSHEYFRALNNAMFTVQHPEVREALTKLRSQYVKWTNAINLWLLGPTPDVIKQTDNELATLAATNSTIAAPLYDIIPSWDGVLPDE